MFQQIYSTFVHVAISIFLMWTINYVSCHQFFCYGLLLVWSISDCWNSWQFLHNNDKIYLPLGSQEVLQIPPKYTLFKEVIKFVMLQNKQKVCRCSCHCNFSNSVTRISKLKKKKLPWQYLCSKNQQIVFGPIVTALSLMVLIILKQGQYQGVRVTNLIILIPLVYTAHNFLSNKKK